MRKYILIFFVLASTISVQQIFAQESDFQKEWSIGAGFGVNMSDVDFATSYKNSPFGTTTTNHLMGGVALRYLTEKNLGLIAELNFSQQGWKQSFKEDYPDLDYAHSHQLNYLELPLLTHIYFGNKVRVFFNLGPKFSFLISDSETMSDELRAALATGDLPSSFSTAQYFRSPNRKFDYAIMGGLGLEFRTGIGSFSLEGRYTFGLGDIFSNKKSDHFQRSANRVMGVKLTYYVKAF